MKVALLSSIGVVAVALLAACASEDPAPDVGESQADDDLALDDDSEAEQDDESADDESSDDGSSVELDAAAPPVFMLGDGGVQVNWTGEGIECGSELCYNAQLADFPLGATACCADEATSSCGLDMTVFGELLQLADPGCEPLATEDSPSSDCPNSEPINAVLPDAPPEGVVLPGCCSGAGTCGYLADFGDISFGCVSPERFDAEPGAECASGR
jgi:hypothetical protein